MLLLDSQRDRVEPLNDIGQAAGYGVIDAQFIDHLASPLVHLTDENAVGARN
jgi:hypothetical protein